MQNDTTARVKALDLSEPNQEEQTKEAPKRAKRQEPWPASKALTVYNVLRLREVVAMPIRDITPYLREHFDPKYPQEWVMQGIEWLVEKKLVSSNGIFISATNLTPQGKPAKVVRSKNTDADLSMSEKNASTP